MLRTGRSFFLPLCAAGILAGEVAVFGAGEPATDLRRVNAAVVDGKPMARVIIQPNGWGSNPANAIKDLDRIMRFYEKLPGFRRDRYVKVIEIGRGKFQADGRCSYLAPKRSGSRR